MSTTRPWLPWYPADILTDAKYLALSRPARLVYRELLDHLWLSGAALTNNPRKLAGILGISLEEWEEIWPELTDPEDPCFIEHPDQPGRITNRRLLAEWEKAEEMAEVARQNGRAGGRPRKPGKTQPVSTGIAKPNPDESYPHPHPQSQEDSPTPAAPEPEGGGKPTLDSVLADSAHPLHGHARWFDEVLWPRYPPRNGRKVGKAEAWEWVCQRRPGPYVRRQIEAKLREDLESGDWKRGVGIKDCVRWLKAGEKNGWRCEHGEFFNGAFEGGERDDPYAGM